MNTKINKTVKKVLRNEELTKQEKKEIILEEIKNYIETEYNKQNVEEETLKAKLQKLDNKILNNLINLTINSWEILQEKEIKIEQIKTWHLKVSPTYSFNNEYELLSLYFHPEINKGLLLNSLLNFFQTRCVLREKEKHALKRIYELN